MIDSTAYERIRKELTENPNEPHKTIAKRLSITSNVVAMVCRDISNGKSCLHGSEINARQRQAAINISDADWKKFKAKYASAAHRLGELVRKDIK